MASPSPSVRQSCSNIEGVMTTWENLQNKQQDSVSSTPGATHAPVRYSLPELLYRRQSLGVGVNSDRLSLSSIGRRSFPPPLPPPTRPSLSCQQQQQQALKAETVNSDNGDDDDGAVVVKDQLQPRQSFRPVPTSYLSYRGAWNATRLQNTILVVGPGTPASVLWNTATSRQCTQTTGEGETDTPRGDDNDEEMERSQSSSSHDHHHHQHEQQDRQHDRQQDINRNAARTEDAFHAAASSEATPAGGGSRRSRWTLANDEGESFDEDDGEDADDDEENKSDTSEADGDNDDDDSSHHRLHHVRRRQFEDILQNEGDADTGGVYQLMDTDDEENDDDDDESEDEGGTDDDEIYLARLGREEESDEDSESDDDDDDDDVHPFRRRHHACRQTSKINSYFPSMRHSGCINTASWLDCGWRLSTYTTSDDASAPVVKGIFTEECTTQVVTSGDDYNIKFWDLADAMGTASPLAGGQSTVCPFSASTPTFLDTVELEEKWAETFRIKRRGTNSNPTQNDDRRYLPGCVRLLASLNSGHHGNVFHVTPLRGNAGKVATCAADGFLRLVDVEMNASSPIVSPEYDDELGLLPAGFLSFRSAMCFSHHFLNENVGLLCSERGLRQFDLRLPPREQPRERLLGGSLFRSCKACAILSTSSNSSSFDQGDPSYFFAGGSSPTVALCDIRKTGGRSSSSILQYYRPSSFSSVEDVSVSGLDVSKDGKELLVSYESDQIYTFPVFPHSKVHNSSTSDCINELILQTEQFDQKHVKESAGEDEENNDATLSPHARRTGKRHRRQKRKPLKELAAYGGHLNRFTFLKNARYAGPRDEYICTGSDSGHAWIYDKSTGGVVSFLKADNSTCNGIVPHPSLPIFVTYGIDSTAKLWRSTVPVDFTVDDSVAGRRRHASKSGTYRMSAVVSNWNEIQAILLSLEPSDMSLLQTDIYPDQIPRLSCLRRNRLSRSNWIRRAYASVASGKAPGIGNNLHNLPQTLGDNLFACLQSMFDDSDVPVESDVEKLKHRITLIRLRHQADRLGLKWDPRNPWIMEQMESNEDTYIKYCPADLVPDYPSDWIPYDPDMCDRISFDFDDYFNKVDYLDFYREQYSPLDELGVIRSEIQNSLESDNCNEIDEHFDSDGRLTNVAPKNTGKDPKSSGAKMGECENTSGRNAYSSEVTGSHDAQFVLLETMTVLKYGGNAALKSGDLDLAATRYDKAIQYGAVHFMRFFAQTGPNLHHSPLGAPRKDAAEKVSLESPSKKWSSLLKTMIVCRLNLAFVLLKPRFDQAEVAASLAELALEDLISVTDFEVRKKAQGDSSSQGKLSSDEPDPVVDEALSLQSKAFYRLGCAQFSLKKFHCAIESFESSILSTQLIGDGTVEPDSVVFRRLREARHAYSSRTKRQRKKFKLAFSVASPSSSPPTSPSVPLKGSSAATPPSTERTTVPVQSFTPTTEMARSVHLAAVTPDSGTVYHNAGFLKTDYEDDMKIDDDGKEGDDEEMDHMSRTSTTTIIPALRAATGGRVKKQTLPHSNTM